MEQKQLVKAMKIIGEVMHEEEAILFNYSGATLSAVSDMLDDFLSRPAESVKTDTLGVHLTLLMRMQDDCREVYGRYRPTLAVGRISRKDLYDLGPSAVLCVISLALGGLCAGCIGLLRGIDADREIHSVMTEMAALNKDLEKADQLLKEAEFAGEKQRLQQDKAEETIHRQKENLKQLALFMANPDEMNV